MPQREAFRVMGALPQLPEALTAVRELRTRLEELQRGTANNADTTPGQPGAGQPDPVPRPPATEKP